MRCCSGFAFTEIAAGDLDIAIVGQLLPADLPLGDEFEPGPMKVIGFEAAFRSWAFREQLLKDEPGYANDALIIADADAEFDSGALGIPARVQGKTKEHFRLLGGEVTMFV